MSEFLVMAATLINIKSRMLLPAADSEDEQEEDPRQELVDKLLEYKMFKYVSSSSRTSRRTHQKILFKPPTIPKKCRFQGRDRCKRTDWRFDTGKAA